MTPRDKKIIDNAERLGIPIFVLVAKDKLSVDTLNHYFEKVLMQTESEQFHLDVIERIDEFTAWQKDNPDQVKLPD